MDKEILEKLNTIEVREAEILELLSSGKAQGDTAAMTALMKEQAMLSPVTACYGKYRKELKEAEDDRELLLTETDPDMRSLYKEDLARAEEEIRSLEHELKILLIPKDPNDTRDAIVEIRGGAGGDEAALFAADLYRMYVRYADRMGWRTELVSLSENGIGGFKECTFEVHGRDVWSRMKYESGTHRVQRIPETESGGRIHTSTATGAIMPEAEEVDVSIDPGEIRIDVFRASGTGGQCVNTTDFAVRIVHLPTGITVSCQDEKSQIKNKAKALKVLRAKLYDLALAKQNEERSALRKGQVGTGDRSEKIRTYNFPQGRVTDHRIHLTTHRIEQVMDGDLTEIIDGLAAAEQAEKLSNL